MVREVYEVIDLKPNEVADSKAVLRHAKMLLQRAINTVCDVRPVRGSVVLEELRIEDDKLYSKVQMEVTE